MNGPPPEVVRILLVEDDPADAELMLTALERTEMVVRAEVVDRLEEVRARLDGGGLDVIIADYDLRGWRGTDILALLRDRGLDMPVILVTGSLGEEFADVCLREGATDFVLKDRLGRLAPAVRRCVELTLAERERAAALERVRMLSVAIDQSPAAVFITDTMGRIEYVNRRFSDITGYSPEEALGQTPRMLRSGKTPPELYERLWQTIREGHAWRSEILNRRRSGELYWSQVSISPMRDRDGVVHRFVAVHEDVSERRWAEEAIREREERLRQIAENIREVFWVVAADFSETLYISPAYEEVWGRSCRSLYENPSSFMDAVHGDDRRRVIANITRVRSGEDAGGVEFRVVQPSGDERWVRAHAAGVLDERGEVYRISGVALDITQRREAEERLRESEQRFRRFIDTSFDVIVVSTEGVIREVNRGFERTLGYPPEEVMSRSVLDFVAEDSRKDVQRRVEGGVEGTYEATLLHRSGRPLTMEITARGHVVEGKQGRITAMRDVTEKRALEAQLRQAQKLEAVGLLAGGVAHDFNNLLTVILSEVQLLRLAEKTPVDGPLPEALEEIEAAAKRAAALTRQLLTFSRRDVAEPEVLDAREVLEGLQKMLVRLIGEDVLFDVAVASPVGRVRLDRGHLEQVIVNLVVNARDAMPDGGQLHVEVSDVELGEGHADAEPGPYVVVSVSDTGVGMSEEVKSKIFEPFFTTKPSGKGTGLGLATSYGIVSECGGRIGVYSELGVGTTMRVYLPRVTESFSAIATGAVAGLEATRASATILLVEDDPGVRRSAERVLRHLGCEVIAASGAVEALRKLGALDSKPDLLFTDVVMPDGSGPELVRQARALFPDLEVLYTTGYTADMATRLELLQPGVDVLTKPYTPQDLAAKMRSLLGR